VKDITLQIAAGHPWSLARAGAGGCAGPKEKEIAPISSEQAPQAIAKMWKASWRSSTNLLPVDQGFVKKNSEISVKEHVALVAKQWCEVTIRRLSGFQIGEAARPENPPVWSPAATWMPPSRCLRNSGSVSSLPCA